MRRNKNRVTIAVVCTINKICTGEIPQETQVKNRKNRKNRADHKTRKK